MLEVRDLHCSYDQTEIVHGVSFDVPDGQFCCIIGAHVEVQRVRIARSGEERSVVISL